MKTIFLLLFVLSFPTFAGTFDYKRNAHATSECELDSSVIYAVKKAQAKEMAKSIGAEDYYFTQVHCIDKNGKHGWAIQVFQTDKAN